MIPRIGTLAASGQLGPMLLLLALSHVSYTQQVGRPPAIHSRQYDEDGGRRYHLPPFRHSGGPEDSDDRGSGPGDKENLGFVRGPPEGFPSFEDIQADFPKFSGGGGREGGPTRSHSHSEPHYFTRPPSSHRGNRDYRDGGPPFSSGPYSDPPEYDDAPDDQGPNSIGHGPPPRPYNLPPAYNHNRPPPHQGPHSHFHPRQPYPHRHHPEAEVQESPEYHHQGHQGHQSHLPQSSGRPIVLKVSGLKNEYHHRPHALGEGPSVFYAPSPDVRYRQRQRQRQTTGQHDLRDPHDPTQHYESNPSPTLLNRQRHSNQERYHSPQRFRTRRSVDGEVTTTTTTTPVPSIPSPTNTTTAIPKKFTLLLKTPKSLKASKFGKSLHFPQVSLDPMVADGSEQESFWSTPFIMFDHYKKDHDSDDPKGGNVTFHDSTSEEQRFFPSFPSPYLSSLNPFGSLNSLSPQRAPLFPGPSANRSPVSRYPFKFTQPLPNRGPSSAASHNDRDRGYHDNNLLGSGNFEVIRGGTYYGEDDDGGHYHHGGGGGAYHPGGDDDEAYYPQNNGHSSPYRGGGDFFANFRDFADINPHSRSFSNIKERVVGGVGGGYGSRVGGKKKPENIFDKLELEEGLETASSGDRQPQFSMEYDPMMATF